MLIMVFDTETSGLPLYHEPSEGDNQPHIVELAALLIDEETGEDVDTFHCIVKPNGWTIPDEVVAIHGITNERAMDEGIDEAEALENFLAIHKLCGLRVAHNEPFDARIARIAIKRFGGETQEERDAIADTFKSAPRYCTMRASTKACALPPTEAMLAKGMRFNKNPSLAEAYRHFTGEDLQGAHSAMADARGCAEVYRRIKAIGA